MKILFLDGNQRSTLAAVRSCGRANHEVYVADTDPGCLAAGSRYVTEFRKCPDVMADVDAFRSFVREEVDSGFFDLVIPMTDASVFAVCSSVDCVQGRTRIPFPPWQLIQIIQDKNEMRLQASKFGILSPLTYEVDGEKCLRNLAPQLRYPAVVKPRRSKVLSAGGWKYGPVKIAKDPKELIAEYHRSSLQIPFPMVQEFVSGDGYGLFLLLDRGEVRAHFSHHRLREKPPWGGVSVLSESVPTDPDLLAKCSAFLKSLGWSGVAMLEFKLDSRDASYRLMEINGRFWGSLQLAIDSGVDFPALLCEQYAAHASPRFQPDYKTGVRLRWLLGDLDSHWIRYHWMRDRSLPSLAWSFVRSSFSSNNEVFRISDPIPAWRELKQYIRSLRSSERNKHCPVSTAAVTR